MNNKQYLTASIEDKYISNQVLCVLFLELIYEICFELVTDSSTNEEIVVDYSAETHFILNHDQIKVP